MKLASWKICHIAHLFFFFHFTKDLCKFFQELVQICKKKNKTWQSLLVDLDFIHMKINDLSRLFSKMF